MICEIIREIEGFALGRKPAIDRAVEAMFSLNRNKAYGYISLVSNQEVLDRYSDLMDYFGFPSYMKAARNPWEEMRDKADAMSKRNAA